METQSGARPALVDPFGREVEAWLRDVPAVHAPYVPDLVVPPVTGPVALPTETDTAAAPDAGGTDAGGPETAAEPVAAAAVVAEPVRALDVAPLDDPAPATLVDPAPAAFRRDRGRHASACAPTFPEPPARISLRIGDLAVELATATGRSTVERISLLEEELRRRDEDRARFAAWEARIARSSDPEVAAARAWATEVFADLLAAAVVARPARTAVSTAATTTPARGDALPALQSVLADALDREDVDVESAGAPVAPVAAVTRPTPLVPPATGPSAIDHEAFVAALRAHTGADAGAATAFPLGPVRSGSAAAVEASAEPLAGTDTDTEEHRSDVAAPGEPVPSDVAATTPSWWARVVARVLRVLRRA
ncbi:hypothetical protein DEI81_01825 [Curtobacterium sp. MCBD17_013]|uniref:hypothetical protein n=1 Tax=Curtobacterium sp. MCBD17_013 TaxID=2175668 RepID=UPI000DA941F5|nr:hypothetical protein [Curtobacterium sp. MCBD17_013]PZF66370.1 hypothetical protein DEI81_01825 [Curtobacterium sp. MCBD17_013]